MKDFSVAFRKSIHSKFPSLSIPRNEEEEEQATRDFMKEWKGFLEKELLDDERENMSDTKDEDHRHVISSSITDGLGPLGKYTSKGK